MHREAAKERFAILPGRSLSVATVPLLAKSILRSFHEADYRGQRGLQAAQPVPRGCCYLPPSTNVPSHSVAPSKSGRASLVV
jgi:hypothetical protein